FSTRLHAPPAPTLFPYTTLFRSDQEALLAVGGEHHVVRGERHGLGDADRLLAGAFHVERDLALALLPIHAVVISPSQHHRPQAADRKSTRLNSSHSQISYAVFCL